MPTPSQKKVLIVEDEDVIVMPLADSLRREGIEVAVAHNGEEGLEAALADVPDLILLDILMPKMDGLTMLKKLRAAPEGARIPVLVLTNLGEITSVADTLEAGISDYLVKSNWKLDDVVRRVNERLARA